MINITEMEQQLLIDLLKQGISATKASGTNKGRLCSTKMSKS